MLCKFHNKEKKSKFHKLLTHKKILFLSLMLNHRLIPLNLISLLYINFKYLKYLNLIYKEKNRMNFPFL